MAASPCVEIALSENTISTLYLDLAVNFENRCLYNAMHMHWAEFKIT